MPAMKKINVSAKYERYFQKDLIEFVEDLLTWNFPKADI